MSVFNADLPPVTRERKENNTKLLNYAYQKRTQKKFNDVTINVGDQTIAANRMILSCYSNFFETMFLSNFKERYEDPITMKESDHLDGNSIKALIEYMYSRRIEISSENVMLLLASADFLQMDEVKKFCFEFLENALSVNTCLQIVKTSTTYGSDSTLKLAFQFISDNFDKLVQEENYKNLEKDELDFFIGKLDRSKVQETLLFKAILKWIQHKDDRKHEFPKLFRTVKISKLPSEFVADEVSKHPLVETNIECSKAVMKYWNIKSEEARKKKTSSKILCIGGEGRKSVAEVYNNAEQPPIAFPDLLSVTSDHCCLKINEYIYCIGGSIDNNLFKATNQVYRMNLNDPFLHWEEIAPMIEGRFDFGAAELNGNIVVAGGSTGQTKLNSAEHYTVKCNKWQKIKPMKRRRCDHALVTVEGSLFAIGGDDDSKDRTVEKRDIDGEWKDVQCMKTSRRMFAAVNFDGCIYSIGGWGDEAAKTVEKYNPNKNQWSYVSNLNVPRWRHAACVLDRTIYVFGGKNYCDDDNSIKKMECYSPSLNSDQWSSVLRAVEQEVHHHALVALLES